MRSQKDQNIPSPVKVKSSIRWHRTMKGISSILVALAFAASVLAFVPQNHESNVFRSALPRLASSLQEPPSPDAIRRDIEEMKKEALERFQKLSVQMEELKERRRQQELHNDESSASATSSTSVKLNKPPAQEHSLDSLEGDFSRQHQELLDVEDSIKADGGLSLQVLSKTESANDISRKPYSLDLLDDTRWKVVFNIGREPGTWMPVTWGVSGERVLFQVEIDFTSEPLYDRDEFFQGITGTKRLDVIEAFLIPRGVGSHSVGRRPVRCKPTGGYKVCRGQGPMGTDLVRLYIELTEDVHTPDHESDVFCPKGRIYATCGYFLQHDSRENVVKQTSAKDLAQQEHRDAVIDYEQLQLQVDADTRLFSVEKFKLMKDLYVAKKRLEEASKQLLLARQREPDKSQLRLSRRRDVGLSKDGGVCCKVQKGVTLEYHILGRMEVGCVDDHKNARLHSHDDNLN